MFRGKKIHFMGAGGIGVSALALLARHGGADVSACDRHRNAQTAMLEQAGIPVACGHDARHAEGVDLLVHTAAVPPEHPERVAADARAEKRGLFLARLMAGRESWGVAGTHGKTTTTWLLTRILIEAGRDPAAFIGGAVPQLGGANYRLGGMSGSASASSPSSSPFVAELDESDASFLLPRLDVAVVTNVESDHLSHYGNDEALFAAFREFASGVAGGGLLVFGIDSPRCRELYAAHAGRSVTFGFADDADFAARNIRDADEGSLFELVVRGEPLGDFALGLPGDHNVQNALAALAAALSSGVSPDAARTALAGARGVGRRMERLGVVDGAVVYSDYAHHPTEVAAAIAAFRRRRRGRTLVVFQPHLYSRTRDYADDFGAALGGAEEILLLDIYPAREEPIPGVDSSLLAGEAARRGAKVNGPLPVASAETGSELLRLAKGCEAVVMMGAGDIDDMAREWVSKWS